MANLKLVLGVLSISSLVVFGNGFNFEEFRSKRQATGNCDDFPKDDYKCDCCTMPEEVLGNLTASFRKCFGKKWEEYRKNREEHGGHWRGRSARQEEFPSEGGEGGNIPDNDSEEGPERPTSPRPAPPSDPEDRDGPEGPGGPGRGPGGPGGPGGRGPGGRGPGGRGPPGRGPQDGQGPDCDKGKGRRGGLSEMFKDLFQKITDFFKNIIAKIRDLLADHFRGARDGCLMECVFQEEQWLQNGKIDTEKIIKRIQESLSPENSKWAQIAEEAVHFCQNSKAEEGKKCQSGSEEFFMCLGRRIFINCPEFKDNDEQCNRLKEFYESCPAKHPVPLRCHHHGPPGGPPRGPSGEDPSKYQSGHGSQSGRYHGHH